MTKCARAFQFQKNPRDESGGDILQNSPRPCAGECPECWDLHALRPPCEQRLQRNKSRVLRCRPLWVARYNNLLLRVLHLLLHVHRYFSIDFMFNFPQKRPVHRLTAGLLQCRRGFVRFKVGESFRSHLLSVGLSRSAGSTAHRAQLDLCSTAALPANGY